MYLTQLITISKAVNGFVLEACVPLKPEAKKTNKMSACCCVSPSRGSVERQYIAKNAAEIADLVEDIMPLLDQEFKTENEFDAAFKKATAESMPEEEAEK